MTYVNHNYLKLKAGYLFPEISRRRQAFQQANLQARLISLGIGDVTRPMPPALAQAFHRGVDEMTRPETFKGYGPSEGYDFLRQAILDNEYKTRGVDLDIDEIFVSDGSKCDTGNFQEIFSLDNVVAVADPVYPVYVDTNVMAGRTGPPDQRGWYERMVYMPCTAENHFLPELPDRPVDLIYLCYPNNPTGATARREVLTEWVQYARENNAIILFDAAYHAFITENDIPHSIYEIPGAKDVAVEFRSFSKSAGFTGVRCAFTVVPKQIEAATAAHESVKIHKLWQRRHDTKFNGVSYPVQVAAAAVYDPQGKVQVQQLVDYYMANATLIRERMTHFGYAVFGGINAPYVWVRTPENMDSWAFFDTLLNHAHVVCTPGSGFGPSGEGYVRLSAFADQDNVRQALDRIGAL